MKPIVTLYLLVNDEDYRLCTPMRTVWPKSRTPGPN